MRTTQLHNPESDNELEKSGERNKQKLIEIQDEKAKTSSHVEIKQEVVNYLGYYSSHEQLMQQLILDHARITRQKIREMVAQGKLFL